MRRVLLVAAVALAVTINGSVFASQNTIVSQELSLNLNTTIDSKLAGEIFDYMAVEYGYNRNSLDLQYQDGTLTIDYVGGLYIVSILQEDGIMVSVEIDF